MPLVRLNKTPNMAPNQRTFTSDTPSSSGKQMPSSIDTAKSIASQSNSPSEAKYLTAVQMAKEMLATKAPMPFVVRILFRPLGVPLARALIGLMIK